MPVEEHSGNAPMASSAWSRLRDASMRQEVRPLRFLLVGATGVGVSTAVLMLATRQAHLATLWGGVAAAIISTGTNFILNDAFTWRDRRRAGLRAGLGRMIRYYSTTAVGNGIYVGVLAVLVQRLRVFDLLANLIAIGVGGTFNYLIHNVWTWGRGDRP